MTDIVTPKMIETPLSKEEFMTVLKGKNTSQLHAKLKLGDFVCNCLKNDPDPRASATVARMRREQEWIQNELAARQKAARKARGEPEPSSQVVRLKTLKYHSSLRYTDEKP